MKNVRGYQVVKLIKLGLKVLTEEVIGEYATVDEARKIAAVYILNTDLMLSGARVAEFIVKEVYM